MSQHRTFLTHDGEELRLAALEGVGTFRFVAHIGQGSLFFLTEPELAFIRESFATDPERSEVLTVVHRHGAAHFLKVGRTQFESYRPTGEKPGELRHAVEDEHGTAVVNALVVRSAEDARRWLDRDTIARFRRAFTRDDVARVATTAFERVAFRGGPMEGPYIPRGSRWGDVVAWAMVQREDFERLERERGFVEKALDAVAEALS